MSKIRFIALTGFFVTVTLSWAGFSAENKCGGSIRPPETSNRAAMQIPLFSSLRSRTGKRYYWPYDVNTKDSEKFTDRHRSVLKNILEGVVEIFNIRGAQLAYQILLQEELVLALELEVRYSDWTVHVENGHPLHFDKTFEQMTLKKGSCSFDPLTKVISLPRFHFIDLKTQKELLVKDELYPQLENVFQELFLAVLEEWTHAAQFAHGSALSTRHQVPLTGELNRDYPKIEQEIPLVFEEWGLPVPQSLIDRHDDVGRNEWFRKFPRI